jgi:hypothetical protein
MGIEEFSTLNKQYKVYREGQSYDDMPSTDIFFNSADLVLDNITDIAKIMSELNEISQKIFVFGTVYDSQNRVVQQLEDEFELWKAKNLRNLDAKEFKTEGAKERYLMVTFEEDYTKKLSILNEEKYKLSLMKRVVSGLENYGYKLHALKDASMAIERNS